MNLPPNHRRGLRHAGMMFLIGGMESVTRALIKGDGFEDAEGLEELARRAGALQSAIYARLDEIKES